MQPRINGRALLSLISVTPLCLEVKAHTTRHPFLRLFRQANIQTLSNSRQQAHLCLISVTPLCLEGKMAKNTPPQLGQPKKTTLLVVDWFWSATQMLPLALEAPPHLSHNPLEHGHNSNVATGFGSTLVQFQKITETRPQLMFCHWPWKQLCGPTLYLHALLGLVTWGFLFIGSTAHRLVTGHHPCFAF
jgi:hypothetical protein